MVYQIKYSLRIEKRNLLYSGLKITDCKEKIKHIGVNESSKDSVAKAYATGRLPVHVTCDN